MRQDTGSSSSLLRHISFTQLLFSESVSSSWLISPLPHMAEAYAAPAAEMKAITPGVCCRYSAAHGRAGFQAAPPADGQRQMRPLPADVEAIRIIMKYEAAEKTEGR